MHIFITGASGFIGKNLVPFLLDRKCRLTCLLRNPIRLPDDLRSKVTVIMGELNNLGPDATRALQTTDAVVHLAGQPWGRTYHEFDLVNRCGTENLIRTTVVSGTPLKRFVYISSLAAAGPARLGRPLTEKADATPISRYGQTKLAGERILLDAPFPWTVLRLPPVYGPHDQDVRRFFRLAARHIRPYTFGGRIEVSLVHVRDVCQAIWLILTEETRTSSTYFLNDGQPIHRFNDVTALLAELSGKWSVPMPFPLQLLWIAEGILALGARIGLAPYRLTADKLRELRQQAWTCSAELISANLGYKSQVPLNKGLAGTFAWYRNNQWR